MSRMKKAAQVLQHQDGGEQTRLDGFDELLNFKSTTRPCKAQGGKCW